MTVAQIEPPAPVVACDATTKGPDPLTVNDRVALVDGMIDAFDIVYEAELTLGDSNWRDSKRAAMRAALSVVNRAIRAAAEAPLRARVAELERQRDDLQAANNRYVARSRDAERRARDAEAALDRSAKPTHRHVKSGGLYTMIDCAQMQCSLPADDMAALTIYRSDKDGSLWARPTYEFNDGRFVELKGEITQ